MNDFLSINKVSKHFGSLRAVDEVSLNIGRGEIFSLLGPSGCGKTTLLKMLAGFEKTGSGRLVLNGQDITGLSPERRPVNTVFQNYALFPHLSVWENIAFGLRVAKKSRVEIKSGVERMLSLIQLQGHEHKRPALLSGGQRQRVAIARALVNEPQVLLLDEPLAALDLKLRQHMLAELQAIHSQVGTTFIYVTHDQGEALSLSHRIAVMQAGKVAQVDTPRALYETPATSFVAEFIGDANFLDAKVESLTEHGTARVFVEGLGSLIASAPVGLTPGQQVRVMIRPEKIHLTQDKLSACENCLPAELESATYFGTHSRLQIRVAGRPLMVQQPGRESVPGTGAVAWAAFEAASARILK